MTPDDERAQLVEVLYADLRARAGRLVAHHAGSVAPTSLVHEAMERLYRVDPGRWRSPTHFKATAARAMRQLLLDRVKAKGRQKRGGQLERVTLTNLGSGVDPIGAIDLAAALEALEQERPRCAEVVQLRALGGLELEEIASTIDISLSTAKRDWRTGRAFLLALLGR